MTPSERLNSLVSHETKCWAQQVLSSEGEWVCACGYEERRKRIADALAHAEAEGIKYATERAVMHLRETAAMHGRTGNGFAGVNASSYKREHELASVLYRKAEDLRLGEHLPDPCSLCGHPFHAHAPLPDDYEGTAPTGACMGHGGLPCGDECERWESWRDTR